MARPPELFLLLSSDRVVYWLVGAFTVVVFAVALGVLSVTRSDGIGSRELVGFVVGFGLFVGSYVAAMEVYRVLSR